jgi:hypothetical protein
MDESEELNQTLHDFVGKSTGLYVVEEISPPRSKS